MKTKIFASIFLLLLTCCASLKEKQDSSPTTMDLLMKYKWLFLDTDYFSYTQEFTTTSIYDKMEFPNQEMIKGRSSYYLSNSKARRFNNKKRGVKKNGKYIKEKNWGSVVVSEILEINDTSLIIRETRFGHIARFKAMPK